MAAIPCALRGARGAVVCVAVLAVAGPACRREASAQVVRDPMGPIGCFVILEALGISSQSALELCAGATTEMPGRCFAEAEDRFDLPTGKMVALCRGATSLAPIGCFERLDAEGTLTEDQIIGYCALNCPVGPAPPEISDPACMTAAIDRGDLSNQQAGELCLGASSAGPVDCFSVGEDEFALTTDQLTILCRERLSCQYYNTVPTP